MVLDQLEINYCTNVLPINAMLNRIAFGKPAAKTGRQQIRLNHEDIFKQTLMGKSFATLAAEMETSKASVANGFWRMYLKTIYFLNRIDFDDFYSQFCASTIRTCCELDEARLECSTLIEAFDQSKIISKDSKLTFLGTKIEHVKILHDNEIQTVSQFLSKSDEDLLSIEGIGKKTITKINNAIAKSKT